MDPAEVQFRRVESVLDELVGKAQNQLRSADMRLEDRSARKYHYKNNHLVWSYAFLKEWRIGTEKARLTVVLSYGEPVNSEAVPEIELTWRAELFQQGQESRIDTKGNSKCSLADVERYGILTLVNGAVQEGTAHLPKAL